MNRCHIALAGLLCLLLLSGVEAQIGMNAILSGGQVVPPVATNASGFLRITLNQPANTLTYWLTTTGLQGTAAHIHLGAFGQNGAVVFTLAGGPAEWRGTTGALTAAQRQALFAEGMYVDVHTQTQPNGLIRGQLRNATRRRFFSTILGNQMVPPVQTNGSAYGDYFLNREEGVLTYDVKTLTALSIHAGAARIHTAPPGQNGPVLFTLTGPAGVGGQGSWCGTSPQLTTAQQATLQSDGNYVQIASNGFPNGEVRGQILRDPTELFTAKLSGSEVVPSVNTAATGFATLKLQRDLQGQHTIDCTVTVTGMTGTTAHVHLGFRGQNGATLLTLAGGPTTFSGVSGVLTNTDVEAVLRQRTYVDVHSAANPGGQIRGQVVPNPMPFGFGSIGTGGLNRIGTNTVTPDVGQPVLEITLRGARSNSAAYLILSTSSPAPLDLGGTGAQGAFLFVDPASGFFLQAQTDANGCARITTPIPNNQALKGFVVYLQWVVVDAGAAGGFTVSDALRLVIM